MKIRVHEEHIGVKRLMPLSKAFSEVNLYKPYYY